MLWKAVENPTQRVEWSCTFSRNSISSAETHLCINIEGQFEGIGSKIGAKHRKRNLIISDLYRIPHGSGRETIVRYETVMTNICSTGNDILVGIDQNVDYIKFDNNTKMPLTRRLAS